MRRRTEVKLKQRDYNDGRDCRKDIGNSFHDYVRFSAVIALNRAVHSAYDKVDDGYGNREQERETRTRSETSEYILSRSSRAEQERRFFYSVFKHIRVTENVVFVIIDAHFPVGIDMSSILILDSVFAVAVYSFGFVLVYRICFSDCVRFIKQFELSVIIEYGGNLVACFPFYLVIVIADFSLQLRIARSVTRRNNGIQHLSARIVLILLYLQVFRIFDVFIDTALRKVGVESERIQCSG